ncbi:hypothetical protein Acsp01_68450 [Actinoplanes sp. NBRC 101535]|nr:hypothetical protein Acsp01_68450 [Actinoplanes sp. NBRC 101535]
MASVKSWVLDRLVLAALLGGLRQRSWSVLIVAAFAVVAAAGAAPGMFAEASGNAAFQARRDQTPASAQQNDAAVVRVSANVGPRSLDQVPVTNDLRQVPHLTEPDLTGGSIGAELVRPQFWSSTVGVAGQSRAGGGNDATGSGGTDGVTGRGGAERARLFAVEAPAEDLVAVGPTADGRPRAGDDAARDGLWLPQPVAESLGVRAGDEIVVAVTRGTDGEAQRATATVDGIFAVDAGGRLPADPAGRHQWALRRSDVPGDTEYRTLPSYLLVGDVATVERLAEAVGDQLFWSAESELAPGVTLAEARRTADRVEELRRRYATDLFSENDDPLALRFASGIQRIADDATGTTDAVRQRTRPVEWAAVAVGLASVLAVALLSARRRERELRHAVAVGMSAPRIGGLWLLEHLLPAVLGAVTGWLVAWQLVERLGPPGRITASLQPAALSGGGAVLAGLALVAGVGAVAAARRVRPAPPATARRALPWGTMVVAVALVAAGGLVSASGPADGTRGVDLLVPLLVLCSVGVIGGWLPTRLAHRRAGATPPAGRTRVVFWLTRRRLGAGGTERRLAVLVVTAGLGMLLFALSAVHATRMSAQDRVAVAAGAEAVATIEGSWVLDADAIPVPVPDPADPASVAEPVPGVRTPSLPPGNTVVWLADVTTPLDDYQKDLLIVDPARFGEVALWGNGPELAAARAALTELAARPAADDGSPRAIVVADPAAARVPTVRMMAGPQIQDLEVASRVDAFPGMRGRAMYVVAADPMFTRLGAEDPRLRPRTRQPQGMLFLRTFLWNSSGRAGAQAITDAHGTVPERIDTADQLRQDAAYVATGRARGYQVAIAGYLALVALLTLGIYAQRTAAARRPADLMLARAGLGRRGVGRARALEFVLLAAVAFAAAVAGVAALTPLGARLLDDQPGLLPAYTLEISANGLAVTAIVAVVATLLAIGLTTVRSASSEEDAYRDD